MSLEKRIQYLEHKIWLLENSKSYRWTLPLRKLDDWLSKFRRAAKPAEPAGHEEEASRSDNAVMSRPWGMRQKEFVEMTAFAKANPQETYIPVPWGKVRALHPGTIPPQYRDIFLLEKYRCDRLPKPPRILDCGGNVGMASIWFSQAFPGADLTVCEADSRLAGLIRENLAAAGVTNANVVEAAVWTSEGRVTFHGNGDDMGSVGEGGGESIRSVDIVELVGSGVDLLKMDIEGAEYVCLERLLESGAMRKVRNLVAELHFDQGGISRTGALISRLESAGFVTAMEVELGPWTGKSAHESPFFHVGSSRMFANFYAWQP
jgi:FkbM family methyltransferase